MVAGKLKGDAKVVGEALVSRAGSLTVARERGGGGWTFRHAQPTRPGIARRTGALQTSERRSAHPHALHRSPLGTRSADPGAYVGGALGRVRTGSAGASRPLRAVCSFHILRHHLKGRSRKAEPKACQTHQPE
jgi:hypothetical protein